MRQESKPRDRVEGRFGFVPLDARVFDPEVGIAKLAPICHRVGVEELNCKIEAAHPSIFLQVPDELVLQAFRIVFLQRPCRVIRARYGGKLHDIRRSVAKWYGAPVAQLLVGLDGLVRLYLCQSECSRHSQLVPEGQGPQSEDWI